jgi:zinc D-Ala-D-Ala carboxypeptidase
MPNVTRVGDIYDDGDFQAVGSGSVFINGLPVARLNDLTAGHGCWPPAQVQTASQTVFANFIAISRVGDLHTIHCCPDDSCHPGSFAVGSPNVFADDGIPGAQPGVSFNIAVMKLQDEEPEAAPLAANDPRQINKNVAYKSEFGQDFVFDNNNPPPVLDAQPPVNKPILATDCIEILAHNGPFNGDFQLSENFTLADLTTDTVVSNYRLIAQQGLSEEEIVCNLRKLCVNVLEPLLNTYGNIQINSGFRHAGNGATNSQHFLGQAADITFSGLRNSDDFNQRAEELKNSGLFDQMIYEQNKPTPPSTWFHMSYKDAKRGSVLTKKAFSNVYLHGLYKLTVG